MSNWPQWVMIAWWIITISSKLGALITLIHHGEYKPEHTGKFALRIIEVGVSYYILSRGGFFGPIGWQP